VWVCKECTSCVPQKEEQEPTWSLQMLALLPVMACLVLRAAHTVWVVAPLGWRFAFSLLGRCLQASLSEWPVILRTGAYHTMLEHPAEFVVSGLRFLSGT
jgi:hypothetical protein